MASHNALSSSLSRRSWHKMYSHNVGVSFITHPTSDHFDGEAKEDDPREKEWESTGGRWNYMVQSRKTQLSRLLIGIYPNTLLFLACTHIMCVSAVSEKKYRDIVTFRCWKSSITPKSPIREIFAPLCYRCRCRCFPSSFGGNTKERCSGLGLRNHALERWPRITVRECRKRPARHSVRSACL